MRANFRTLLLLTAALLPLILPSPLLADDSDHDRAREALEAGKILPLRTILTQLERDYPGQIIEVELEYDDDIWIYEIELLRNGGALVKMKIDATNGTLLGIKGRDIAPGPLKKAKP